MPKISKKWAIVSLLSLAIVATPFIFFSTHRASADQPVTASELATLKSYAGNLLTSQVGSSPKIVTPPSASPAGPVNTTWYFAEGRAGKGFREYLTINNPANTACAATIQYSYTPDNGTPANKPVATVVKPLSRLTESVNLDLGYSSDSSAAASVAATVSVNTTSTPNCKGVVAERSIYFTNFHGISSGTDVLGSTHLSPAFLFADISNGQAGTSYLTFLNPNTTAATIMVVYYSAGQPIGIQMSTVPANSRGTILPGAINLPAHTSAIIASNHPIIAERSTYFTGISAGNTTVSGAYDTVGDSNGGQDYLFAEGYTGGNTQEYITLANYNLNHVASTGTIILKSKTGVTHSIPFSVNAQSQLIFNVNANNTFAGSSPEVSAEVIISAGGLVAAQREMFFSYQHTSTNGQVTTAMGGTDVVGQAGPASHSAYTFAEGYANPGYNDWLTIQNATANAETISVTLLNGLGQSYTQNVSVPANARYTEDLGSLVQTAFHSGTNSSANSFSTTVISPTGAFFAAERSIYFNTSGVSSFATQGGDDIFGYVGG